MKEEITSRGEVKGMRFRGREEAREVKRDETKVICTQSNERIKGAQRKQKVNAKRKREE